MDITSIIESDSRVTSCHVKTLNKDFEVRYHTFENQILIKQKNVHNIGERGGLPYPRNPRSLGAPLFLGSTRLTAY